MTVVLALAGMLIVPTTIFRGLAGGAIFVVLVSIALSMTLLPALMALFGDHASSRASSSAEAARSSTVVRAASGTGRPAAVMDRPVGVPGPQRRPS